MHLRLQAGPNATASVAGAVSGTCHAYTAPGSEGDGCFCAFDCGTTADQCAQGAYTDCTCASADPCHWAQNGKCDDFCAH